VTRRRYVTFGQQKEWLVGSGNLWWDIVARFWEELRDQVSEDESRYEVDGGAKVATDGSWSSAGKAPPAPKWGKE